MYRTLLFSGLLSATSLAPSAAQRPADLIAGDTLDPLPRWATAETVAFLAQPRGFCGSPPALPGLLTSVRLLAWRRATRADGRPVDSGFWLGQGADPDGRPFWIFAKGYRLGPMPAGSRLPLAAAPEGWQLSYVCDVPGRPLTIQRSVPTAADAAMHAPGWVTSHGPAKDSAGIIRQRTWAASLGPPPRTGGIQPPDA